MSTKEWKFVMSQDTQLSDLKNLLNNSLVNKILRHIPILSFIVANALIIHFFSYFLIYPNLHVSELFGLEANFFPAYIKSIIIYLVGGLLSIAFVKPNWMIKISELITANPQNEKSDESNSVIREMDIDAEIVFKSTLDRLKNALWNRFVYLAELFVNLLLMGRMIIFNIFNDSFMLLVFWAFYFFLLSIPRVVVYSSKYDYAVFFSAIGMIGILAGFFQYYIKTYHEKVISKIEKYIMNYVTSYLRESITAADFKSFFSKTNNKKKQEIMNDFIEVINSRKGITKNEMMKTTASRSQRRTPLTINVSNNYFGVFDDIGVFRQFDSVTCEYSTIKKEVLMEMLSEYFQEKYRQFAYKVDNDNLSNLRNMLLPAIPFFDEMNVDLYRLNALSELEDNISNNTSFTKHYEQFLISCYFTIMDKVTLTKSSSKFIK